MKVIVAVDDSPYSKAVVDAIEKRLWPAHISFKVLTVIEPLCDDADNAVSVESGEPAMEGKEKRRQHAEHLCEKVRHRLEGLVEGAKAHCEVREGAPQIEIINAAVDWMADQIILGAHGKDVCPHNLLGSVSQSVVAHAPCSVEIVRAHTRQRQSTNK